MNVYVVNKSRRSAISMFITLALPYVPMIAMGLKLKEPITVSVVQDSSHVGSNDAGILIEDDGRFVSARLLWPVDP
jgi:hypothetical protein